MSSTSLRILLTVSVSVVSAAVLSRVADMFLDIARMIAAEPEINAVSKTALSAISMLPSAAIAPEHPRNNRDRSEDKSRIGEYPMAVPFPASWEY